MCRYATVEIALKPNSFCANGFVEYMNGTTWFNTSTTAATFANKTMADACKCETPTTWQTIDGVLTDVPSGTTDCYCFRDAYRAQAGTNDAGDLLAKKLACAHTMRWILMEWNRHFTFTWTKNSVLRGLAQTDAVGGGTTCIQL